MSTRGYTILGWLVWQVGSRVARRKVTQNRTKLGAVGIIAVVVLAGIAAAKAGSDE